MREIDQINCKKLSDLIKNKSIKALEVTEYFISRASTDKCNVFITKCFDSAIEQAKNIDKEIEKGFDFSNFELLGIPFAAKDVFCTNRIRTTCASKVLENFIPTYESTATKRILENGAILIGKTNQDEFCMGSSNETSAFGPVINPLINKKKPTSNTSPGGSSGGSAVSVLNDYSKFSIGSDTGGSIKQPAAFCGIYGFRPTYGSISRYGMISYSGSLDQCGFFSKNVDDLALLYDVISGRDERDMGMFQGDLKKISPDLNNFDPKNFKIGIPNNKIFEMISPEMKRVWIENIKKFEKAGTEIIEFEIPNLEYAIECYAMITMSEAFSNLSRYDGIKFGERVDVAQNLLELYKKSRSNFGYQVKKRLTLGAACLSHDMYEKSYLKATKVRRLIENEFLDKFKLCDVIFMPTVADVAFAINEKKNQFEMWLVDLLTLPSNLAGLGGLSISGGTCNETDLPLGLQIISSPFQDLKMLQAAKILEFAK